MRVSHKVVSHEVMTAAGAVFAMTLTAGAAAAFPSLPHFGKPKTKPTDTAAPAPAPTAAASPGVYFIAQVDTALYLVDATTVADGAEGRRTANIYVLERSGLHRRDTDDFDCRGHQMHKTSGFNFKLNDQGTDVTVYKTPGVAQDHGDPQHSVIRGAEDFVCQWPNFTSPPTRLSDIPDDEHARMVKLGQSAQEILSH